MMAAHNGQTNAVGQYTLSMLLLSFPTTYPSHLTYSGVSLSHIEVLVSSAKADLTLQDTNKNTALHLACSKVILTHAPYMVNQMTVC